MSLEGCTLGAYRVLERVGEGGMADIYRAYHPATDRYVALKVLPARYAEDPSFIQHFRREARTIARLEHRHILPVYDFGEQDGTTYLVMRYLDTGTLKDRLQRASPPLADTVRIVGQVAAALDHAHRAGVIHRDVKPSNILIDAAGDAYLTDFGIAKLLDTVATISGSGLMGTPAYMAPEQVLGEAASAATDIYSLGIVLYEMVTGRVPYTGETPIAVALKHVHDPLPAPSKVVPDLSPQVERVILKALAKEPGDRFSSAGALASALALAAGGADVGPVLVDSSGDTVRLPDRLPKTEPVAAGPTVQPAPARRVGWRLAAGGLFVLVAALAVWWLAGGRGQTGSLFSAAGFAPTRAALSATPQGTATPVDPVAAARAFAEPLLASTAGRPPDYQDSFESPLSGWPVGSTPLGEWGYAGGEYFIVSRDDTDRSLCCDAVQEEPLYFADFVLEADVRFASEGLGSWGLIFRFIEESAGPERGHYGVLVGTDGSLDIFKNVDGIHTELAHFPSSAAIRSGQSTNHLQIVAQGPHMAVWMNGEPVWYVVDESLLRAGMLALRADANTAIPLRVQFDGLRVWNLAGGGHTSIVTATPALHPTPTLAPTEAAAQAEAFAGPILASIAGRMPDYADDFDDPASGWPTGPDERGGQRGYEGGEYFFRVPYLPPERCCLDAVVTPPPDFSDFIMEFDVRFAAGDAGVWGMTFRRVESDDLSARANYGIGVDLNGHFSMYKEVGAVNVLLVDGIAVPGFDRWETIHVTIIARGSQLAVYVNSEPLWYITDPSCTHGTFIMGASSDTATPVEARFDNLRVWDISAG